MWEDPAICKGGTWRLKCPKKDTVSTHKYFIIRKPMPKQRGQTDDTSEASYLEIKFGPHNKFEMARTQQTCSLLINNMYLDPSFRGII